MKSPLFFEFEDLPWFPRTIRDSMTDYLRHVFALTDFYGPVIPLLAEAMKNSGATSLVDLCSGSGGPAEQVQSALSRRSGREISVMLTDRHPNLPAWQLLAGRTSGGLWFSPEPVDAVSVPRQLEGFRTMFSGLHHFSETGATQVLRSAVDARQGIAIFDGADRSLITMLGILIVHPVAFLLLTPFLKPFRFSRLAFTYLLPVIPVCTVWDGLVSILRLHPPSKMMKMARAADHKGYTWKAGKLRNRYGLNLSYLIGYPINSEA